MRGPTSSLRDRMTRCAVVLVAVATMASCAGTYGYRTSIGVIAGSDGSVGVMAHVGVHGGFGRNREGGGDAAVVVLEGVGNASTKSSGAGFGFGVDYVHFGPLTGRIGLRNVTLFGGSEGPRIMPSIVASIGKPVREDRGPTLLGVELRAGLPIDQVDGKTSYGPVQFFLGASLERHRWWDVEFFPSKR